MAPTARVMITSSDGHVLEIEEEVAFQSLAIKDALACGGADTPFSAPYVSREILGKVFEYAEYHLDAGKETDGDKPTKSEEEIKQWDADFLRDNEGALVKLCMAASYLRIPGLLDLACQAARDRGPRSTSRPPPEVEVHHAGATSS
ncbi:hypothetical protein WJX72_000183 [[Myrmecia] bisecta]|uniref:SKP1 component POZ domain-containing protein n=1 Tax=[Myrmecia] bisecta TaxID=41462 RepID=A0AAW1P3S8_9CHLO